MSEHENDASTSASAGPWSRYWASGVLHSCPGAFAGNYDDEIRDHWLAFFGGLPNGARVLDIGTGNGAVAFLARDAAHTLGREFHIEGIDAALIIPSEAAARHGLTVGHIVFRGGTACEQTGYPDRSFHAVSSQYAIEYSRVGDTLNELARILKPGGRAGFIMHHSDSRAVETTRAEIGIFDYLREEAPLIAVCRRLLAGLAESGDEEQLLDRLTNREAQQQHREIASLLQSVTAYARSQPQAAFVEGIAVQVSRTLQRTPTTGPAAALDSLTVLEEEMAAHRERLQANLRAAQSGPDVERFCQSAVAAGFIVDTPPAILRRGEDLLGWTVTATRES